MWNHFKSTRANLHKTPLLKRMTWLLCHVNCVEASSAVAVDVVLAVNVLKSTDLSKRDPTTERCSLVAAAHDSWPISYPDSLSRSAVMRSLRRVAVASLVLLTKLTLTMLPPTTTLCDAAMSEVDGPDRPLCSTCCRYYATIEIAYDSCWRSSPPDYRHYHCVSNEISILLFLASARRLLSSRATRTLPDAQPNAFVNVYGMQCCPAFALTSRRLLR